MDDINTNWNKNEFLSYLLICAMEADFKEEGAELDYIKQRVGGDTYRKMKAEFDADSDIESADKIQATYKALNYSADEKSELVHDIKELFFTDGEMDTLERNLLMGLKKLM